MRREKKGNLEVPTEGVVEQLSRRVRMADILSSVQTAEILRKVASLRAEGRVPNLGWRRVSWFEAFVLQPQLPMPLLSSSLPAKSAAKEKEALRHFFFLVVTLFEQPCPLGSLRQSSAELDILEFSPQTHVGGAAAPESLSLFCAIFSLRLPLFLDSPPPVLRSSAFLFPLETRAFEEEEVEALAAQVSARLSSACILRAKVVRQRKKRPFSVCFCRAASAKTTCLPFGRLWKARFCRI